MAERLTRDDWVAAGLAALARGGVDGVRVLPLAKALGVTRGSFYWHFADRDALLKAVLDRWTAEQTDGVIQRAAEDGGAPARDAPAEELRRLLTLCFADDGALERAMRSWAVSDAAVEEVVASVDGRRIAHLATLLRSAGIADAEARARVGYRAWLGEYLLVRRTGADDLARDLDALLALLTRP